MTHLTQPGIGRIKERTRVFASYLRCSAGSPRGNSFFRRMIHLAALGRMFLKAKIMMFSPLCLKTPGKPKTSDASCLKVKGYQCQCQRLLKPECLKQIAANKDETHLRLLLLLCVSYSRVFPLVALVKRALYKRH